MDTPCDCHYLGTLIDGTQFDSSFDRGKPSTFAPNQVIKGWTEAMQLMVEGDKWEMYIPYHLAYGEHGKPPKIPAKSTLIFIMELVKDQRHVETGRGFSRVVSRGPDIVDGERPDGLRPVDREES